RRGRSPAADPEDDARPRTPARGGRRHRREPRSAPAARRRERRGHRARQRARGMDCVGRIGQLLRRGTRGRDQRPARAAPAGLRVTLGNAEVKLDELVAAYSTFARGGVYRAPQFLSSTASCPSIPSAVLSPRAAFFITDILSDDNARAWVFGRGGNLEFPFPV